jgi:FkbM family methyltransferase
MTDREIEELITALYEMLLLRSPDAQGFSDKFIALSSGRQSIAETIRAMLYSAEFSRIYPIFIGHYLGQTRFTNDVSQFGEIELLIKHMINRAATHRIVVDVGARGKHGSNSYDLLRVFGWRGLLIEANPALIDDLQRDFADLDVRIVNCAVSDYSGDGVLHIGVNDDVSSLQENIALGWGPIRGGVAVPVRRLSEILQEHMIPLDFDLLSLDIEGEDVAVFNELVGSGYRPRWVIIEVSYSSATLDATRTLRDAPFSSLVWDHYTLVAQTEPNLILNIST